MIDEEQLRQWIEMRQAKPGFLQDIESEIAGSGHENEQIFYSQVNLLKILVTVRRATRILELGTFLGFSTSVFTKALEDLGGGSICTVDQSAEAVSKARSVVYAPESVDISYRVGDAESVCHELLADDRRFDLVLLDVDESCYPQLFSLCVDLLETAGILVIDNLLMATVAGWHSGENVVEADGNPKMTALRRTIELIQQEDRVESAIVPLGSGMGLCVKR
ncbi:class I SAM-dependent methyltransferase [Kribbella sp. NPDC006257]|uniref:O-methyltransferase n=1 Tax=Kribbella sp. NPDC006257 TaxID=3156738 RepID=UPI0033B1B368